MKKLYSHIEDDNFKDIPGFIPDAVKNYPSGYIVAFGLELTGLISTAIIFPPGVDIRKEYLTGAKYEKDGSFCIKDNNWLPHQLYRFFYADDADIFPTGTRQVLVFSIGIGTYAQFNESLLLITDSTFKAAASKYTNVLKKSPSLRKKFDDNRSAFNDIEKAVENEDHEWLNQHYPGKKEVVDISLVDAAERADQFIDELIKYEAKRSKYKKLLNTISSSFDKKRNEEFNKLEAKIDKLKRKQDNT